MRVPQIIKHFKSITLCLFFLTLLLGINSGRSFSDAISKKQYNDAISLLRNGMSKQDIPTLIEAKKIFDVMPDKMHGSGNFRASILPFVEKCNNALINFSKNGITKGEKTQDCKLLLEMENHLLVMKSLQRPEDEMTEARQRIERKFRESYLILSDQCDELIAKYCQNGNTLPSSAILDIWGPDFVVDDAKMTFPFTLHMKREKTLPWQTVTEGVTWDITVASAKATIEDGTLVLNDSGADVNLIVHASYRGRTRSKTIDIRRNLKLIVEGQPEIMKNSESQYHLFSEGKKILLNVEWSVSQNTANATIKNGILSVGNTNDNQTVYVQAEYMKNTATIPVKVLADVSTQIVGPSSLRQGEQFTYQFLYKGREITEGVSWSIKDESAGTIDPKKGTLSIVDDNKKESVIIIAQYMGTSVFKTIQLLSFQRWAIIFGVTNNEKKQLVKRGYADTDAEKIYNWATSSAGGFPEDHVLYLTDSTDTKATTGQLQEALFEWTKQIQPDDFLLFYYAGHGEGAFSKVEEEGAETDQMTKELYLITYDTDPLDKPNTAFPMNRVKQALAETACRNILVVADTCFSGGIGSELFQSNLDFANLVTAKDGVSVFTAADSTQSSYFKGNEWNGGVFTYYFENGLKGEADFDNDSLVTLGEITYFVTKEVIGANTSGPQTPKTYGNIDQTFPLSWCYE